MESANPKSSVVDDSEPLEGEVEPHGDDPDRDIVPLIRRARDSDLTKALGLMMHRHGAAVYRFCREELHDATLADDVHQQIFIEVHRDLRRYAGRSTLRTWLFGIARHRVLDAAKSRRRAAAHIEEDDAADAPDPGPLPGERLDDARLRQALVACLGELGEHVRAAMLLRFQQGFTFEEMGEVCREKPGTLQARVMRAIPVIRACIEARTGGKV